MINIVLYEPEIPTNTGNIMRTCVATNTRLHLIEPLGFKLDDASVKRSGVNYIDKLEYCVYKDFQEFKSKNKGIYYYFTRYGHKPHTSFDYKKSYSEGDIYLIFGKESTGIPREILNSLAVCLVLRYGLHHILAFLRSILCFLQYSARKTPAVYDCFFPVSLNGSRWSGILFIKFSPLLYRDSPCRIRKICIISLLSNVYAQSKGFCK